MSQLALADNFKAAMDAAFSLAAKTMADKIVEQLGPEILANVNTDAIANLAIAAVAAEIHKTLKETRR